MITPCYNLENLPKHLIDLCQASLKCDKYFGGMLSFEVTSPTVDTYTIKGIVAGNVFMHVVVDMAASNIELHSIEADNGLLPSVKTVIRSLLIYLTGFSTIPITLSIEGVRVDIVQKLQTDFVIGGVNIIGMPDGANGPSI